MNAVRTIGIWRESFLVDLLLKRPQTVFHFYNAVFVVCVRASALRRYTPVTIQFKLLSDRDKKVLIRKGTYTPF